MVDESGKLLLTDFGLARMEADAGMTMTGDIVGTLRYMSPEQALAKRVVVDHRSDIYSLGVTLYELLTLQPAFTGDDRQEILRQIAFEEPRRPRKINAGIPLDLETIIGKAHEKNPKDRYATAQELADDLRRFLATEPIKARPPSLLNRAAKWSRRNRTVSVATLLVFGLAMAGSMGWIVRDRAARRGVAETAARVALDEAIRLVGQSKWADALAAVSRAEDVLTIGDYAGPQRTRARELRKDIEIVLTSDVIVDAPIAADRKDRNDIGMLQCRGRAGFVLEAVQLLLAQHGGEGEHLQRHTPTQRKLLGLVNNSHSPAPDFPQDAEIA
jgi:hypothetical protein